MMQGMRLNILKAMVCFLLVISCKKGNNPHVPVDPIPAKVSSPAPGVVPTLPVEPAPSQILLDLSIIPNDEILLVGQKRLLKAIAHYDNPKELREVNAQWSVILNDADCRLDPDGSIFSGRPGSAQIEAAFAGKTAKVQLQFKYPPTQFKGAQFWVYRQEGGRLLFNTPWDSLAADSIHYTFQDVPSYALDCLQSAKQGYADFQVDEPLAAKLDRIMTFGKTHALTFLVNVVPVEGWRDKLRELDRDAYFWLWRQFDKRPSLTFSNFQQGTWVWEVIASPQACLQPDRKEMVRYLDYAAAQLGLSP